MPADGRLIAIGDVHGYSRHLAELLRLVAPTPADTLVFLGDYVNRGDDVPGVIEQVLALERASIPVVPLRGNHEQRLLDAREAGCTIELLARGGHETIRAYHPPAAERLDRGAPLPMPIDDVFAAMPPAHLDFLERTVLSFERDGFLFAHAGVDPERGLAEQGPEDLMHGTERMLERGYRGEATVVFGHRFTAHLRGDGRTLPFEPADQNVIGLDTSVYRSGVLTAMELPSRRIWQAVLPTPPWQQRWSASAPAAGDERCS